MPKLGLAILSAERYPHEKQLGISQGSDVLKAKAFPRFPSVMGRNSLGRKAFCVLGGWRMKQQPRKYENRARRYRVLAKGYSLLNSRLARPVARAAEAFEDMASDAEPHEKTQNSAQARPPNAANASQ
jgi:hypothetical protein